MKAIQGTNAKLVIIGVLSLLILIPMGLIESLIAERQDRKEEAVFDVTSKWGNKQVITGPIITIPYKTYKNSGEKDVIETVRYKHILPESLNIKASMESEIRQRGIYEVVLYNTKVTLEGSFPSNLISHFGVPEKDILFENSVLSLGISDMGGIKKRIEATFSNRAINIEPGLTTKDVFEVGIHSPDIMLSKNSKNEFKISLDINGSESLLFVPVAKENNVSLQSDWEFPSFTGSFLPRGYKIERNGFDAEWKVLNLNRNYPQSWDGNQHQVSDSAFGVKLYIASDLYKKSTRAIKYALLFIIFTFAAFFCAEIMNGNKIHPFQYLLIGLAISIFYILLVSISEHTNFDISYLISSVATVLLIGLYAKSIFKQNRLPLIIMSMLVILYGYLYTLMQLEDLALLIGSIGLFTGLSIIMYITRKIDWYEVTEIAPTTENS